MWTAMVCARLAKVVMSGLNPMTDEKNAITVATLESATNLQSKGINTARYMADLTLKITFMALEDQS